MNILTSLNFQFPAGERVLTREVKSPTAPDVVAWKVWLSCPQSNYLEMMFHEKNSVQWVRCLPFVLYCRLWYQQLQWPQQIHYH